MFMNGLRGAALVAGLTATLPAVPKVAPDFTSNAGMQATCAAFGDLPARQLRGEEEKIAWVVCRDLRLMQRVATTVHQGFQRYKQAQPTTDTLVREARALLEEAVADLRATRKVLATIRVEKSRLRLAPARWQIDLNGDGRIELWEARFFAPPSRQAPSGPSLALNNDPDYYARHTRDAMIRVDRSDVLWALGYHNFLEGLLEFALSYRFDPNARGPGEMLVLDDPERAGKRSFERIRAGFAASRSMLVELKRETDDDEEWIANPRQRNSAFPLELGYRAFALWEAVLDEIDLLLAGKTLLVPPPGAPAICGKGEGLDLRHAWTNPPRQPLATSALRASCRALGGAQQASRLGAMAADARAAFVRSGGDWAMARYLYWVN